MTQPVLYETHSHTPLCKHAEGEPMDYAAIAKTRGLKGLIVTCHNPMPGGFSSNVRMAPEDFPAYLELVEEAREEWEGQIDVRLGLEADFFEGYESWLEEQLSSHDFHYVLGSVHPQIGEYKARYRFDHPIAEQENYFELLAVAAETELFDCLAHPDLIKNETSRHWQPEKIMPNICHALDRIAATGIAMELNTSGANKVVPEMNPFPDMLREIQKREIPIVIGADAHEPDRVADQFQVALDLLERSGFADVSYFLERRRQTVPIPVAKASLTTDCPTH